MHKKRLTKTQGEHVAEYLKQRSLSQLSISQTLSMNPTLLSHILGGRRLISAPIAVGMYYLLREPHSLSFLVSDLTDEQRGDALFDAYTRILNYCYARTYHPNYAGAGRMALMSDIEQLIQKYQFFMPPNIYAS